MTKIPLVKHHQHAEPSHVLNTESFTSYMGLRLSHLKFFFLHHVISSLHNINKLVFFPQGRHRTL